MTTIGLCEDDKALRATLSRALKAEGYDVIPAATGGEAIRAFGAGQPDVVILDLGLPDADGRDVCLALRANGLPAPVLMLTALDAVHHRISGFEAGADDYLPKPFDLGELLARLRVLQRRAGGPAPADGDIVLDPAAHALRKGETTVSLSPTEFKLAAKLVGAKGQVVRRAQLVAAGWPHGAIVSDNTLDSYVRRIRAKLNELEGAGSIQTVRGVGYKWQ